MAIVKAAIAELGEQIADGLETMLQPHGVAVYLEAHHLCTQMRGVREVSPLTRTTFWRGEYEYALNTNERTAASYFERNYVPLEEADRIEFVTREKTIVKGIRVIPTPGHTPFHQSILIESAGERAFYLGDLVPTHAHLPLPWIMGYDVEPLVTLETKRRILKQAVDENWLLIFEHDATPYALDGRSRRNSLHLDLGVVLD